MRVSKLDFSLIISSVTLPAGNAHLRQVGYSRCRGDVDGLQAFVWPDAQRIHKGETLGRAPISSHQLLERLGSHDSQAFPGWPQI